MWLVATITMLVPAETDVPLLVRVFAGSIVVVLAVADLLREYRRESLDRNVHRGVSRVAIAGCAGESSSLPLIRLLGSPDQERREIVPDGTHLANRSEARSEVLIPGPVVKVAFPVVAAFFCAGLDQNLVWIVRGEMEWTLTAKIGLPILTLIALSSLLGAVSAFTNRVWVDYEANELHQFLAVRTAVRTLEPPGTARLKYTPPGRSRLAPTWQLLFEQPGMLAMRVSTPWVRDIRDVLRILQPSLQRNPELAADEATSRAIISPETLSPETFISTESNGDR